jgi:hypothetical protein
MTITHGDTMPPKTDITIKKTASQGISFTANFMQAHRAAKKNQKTNNSIITEASIEND